MSRTLIVIDMQNDFIDGALGTKEAQAIIPNVKAKIEEYRKCGNNIIFTRDTHDDNYLKTREGRHIPVIHCVKGTFGWQISDKIGFDEKNDICIDKPSFGWTHWDDFKFDEVEIIGVCTDVCVVSNAVLIRSLNPEINVTVDAECCAGATPETHKSALRTMEMCQINVVGEY